MKFKFLRSALDGPSAIKSLDAAVLLRDPEFGMPRAPRCGLHVTLVLPSPHLINEQEEELSSSRSDDDSDEEDEDIATEARPEDKENALPNDGSDESSERAKGRTGRKRKRQMAEKALRQAQDTGATRRQRIRQYYNGATHGSASAVQLFAMAMQVRDQPTTARHGAVGCV